MPITCSKLSANIVLDCTNIPVASLDTYFYFGNLSDATFTVDANNNVTGLAMASGTYIYKWEGAEGSSFLNGRYEQRSGNLINGFGHFIDSVLLDDAQIYLNQLANINNGKLFGMLVKKGATTNTVTLYGKTHGLVTTEISGDETNADNEGLPGFVLSTPEGVKENLAPQHVLITDFATTITTLDGLVAP